MVSNSPSRPPAVGHEPVRELQVPPVKWCSVTLSDVLSRGNRLEASVFDLEAKQARTMIECGKYPVVAVCGETGLASAYTRGRFKRIWVEESDYPIYQPSTILDIKPTPDGYISPRTKVDIDALRVRKGQLLMTCSGTIGKVAYVSDTLDTLIFSHDLLRINCKDSCDAGYLYTYFKTAVGSKILTTNQYGAVISHIEAEHLAEVPVPNAPRSVKESIHERIVQSYSLRDASNLLLEQAEQKLVDALALPDLKTWRGTSACVRPFQVRLSQLSGRADASYHVPVVDAIIDHLREYAEEVTTIGDTRISKAVILPGRFKRVYVESGYGRVFIGGKQLGELDPCNKKYLSLVRHGNRITEQLELHENMTLITCSGTIGKVALVGKQWEKWTANQHIIRVVPASEDIAGYLNVFLSSAYGRALISRFTYGSVVDEIDDNHVRQIAIPLLKDHEVQKQINDLALAANQKRYEAYCLEQEALRIMHEEVLFAK